MSLIWFLILLSSFDMGLSRSERRCCDRLAGAQATDVDYRGLFTHRQLCSYLNNASPLVVGHQSNQFASNKNNTHSVNVSIVGVR